MFALLLSGLVIGQNNDLPGNLRIFPIKELKFPRNDTNVLFLEMGFNESIPRKELRKINPDRIQSISLAYSRYRLSESFDQKSLNLKRMGELYDEIPGLRKRDDIKWYWFEQTGCSSPEACKNVFHGFIIFLKSPVATEMKEKELALLDYYTSYYAGKADSRKIDSLIETGELKLTKHCDRTVTRTAIYGNKLPKPRSWDAEQCEEFAKLMREEFKDNDTVHLQVEADEKGNFVRMVDPVTHEKIKKINRFLKHNFRITPGRKNNEKLSSITDIYVFRQRFGYKTKMKSLPVFEGSDTLNLDRFLFVTTETEVCDYFDTSMLKIGKGLLAKTSEVVIKAFDRNKQWKNCLVVTDVTGSMFPYLAQFQMWHRLNLEKNGGNHDFIFFNDGDNLPDILKTSGNVGGLYYIRTDNYEELTTTMKTAMSRGSGGDIPENNIEAVIEGLKKNPSITEVIMIADNQATPRDLDLLSQVKVPIRLILCGAQNGINPAYLTMLRNNKGSLHTEDEDITDLSKLNEGQTIKLDGRTYKLTKNQFVRI